MDQQSGRHKTECGTQHDGETALVREGHHRQCLHLAAGDAGRRRDQQTPGKSADQKGEDHTEAYRDCPFGRAKIGPQIRDVSGRGRVFRGQAGRIAGDDGNRRHQGRINHQGDTGRHKYQEKDQRPGGRQPQFIHAQLIAQKSGGAAAHGNAKHRGLSQCGRAIPANECQKIERPVGSNRIACDSTGLPGQGNRGEARQDRRQCRPSGIMPEEAQRPDDGPRQGGEGGNPCHDREPILPEQFGNASFAA